MAVHTFTLTDQQEAVLTARLGSFDQHVQGIIDNAIEDYAKWRLATLSSKAAALPASTRIAIMQEAEAAVDDALNPEPQPNPFTP